MSGRVLVIGLLVFVAAIFTVRLLNLAGSGASSSGPIRVVSFDRLRDEEVIHLEDDDVFVVHAEGRTLALRSDAQHIGDKVEFCESSGMFESPAHGEKFDIFGHYYGGPATRGLDRHRVTIDDDEVHVDLTKIFDGPERGEGGVREPDGPFCVPS